jgi:hypothetical protein
LKNLYLKKYYNREKEALPHKLIIEKEKQMDDISKDETFDLQNLDKSGLLDNEKTNINKKS